MSEREFRRARASMKHFIQLMLAVMCLAMIAGCGKGDSEQSLYPVNPTGLQPQDFRTGNSGYSFAVDGGAYIEYNGKQVAAKEILIWLTSENSSEDKLVEFLNLHGWKIKAVSGSSYQVDIGEMPIGDAISIFNKQSGLGSATTNDILSIQSTLDPLSEGRSGWNLKAIHAEEAWGLLTTNKMMGVLLGIIDGGFGFDHEDIKFSRIASGTYDTSNESVVFPYCSNGDSEAQPIDGTECMNASHGMNVSSIIAGKANGLGVSGVAKDNSTYPLAYKFNNFQSVYDGFRYMEGRSARVANFSLAYKCIGSCQREAAVDKKSVNDFIRLLKKDYPKFPNILIVQCAGNNGGKYFSDTKTPILSMHSAFFASIVSGGFSIDADLIAYVEEIKRHVIIVGAYDANIRITDYTSRPFDSLDDSFILAPGGVGGAQYISGSTTNQGNVVGAAFSGDSKYVAMGGTSQATPHVTGVAALVLQANPDLSATQVRDIILNNSDTVDGYRALNAEKAVRAALAWGKPTKIVPEEVIAGATQKFSLIGMGLPTDQNFDITFVGCSNIEYLSRTENMHEFSCQMNGSAGSYKAVIRKQGSTEVLASFDVVASKEATPSLATPWKTVWFTVANNYMPVRLNSDGVVQCASSNGVDCFWSTSAESMPAATNPITCNAGYEALTQHWCAQMKDMLTMQWVERPNTGKAYAVGTCGNWRECESKARVLNATLVAINDQAEDTWLKGTFPMNKNYWIGATNDGVAGQWRWVTGEPFSYTNWGQNLNNNGGNEFCAHYYDVTPGVWNDVACNSPNIKGLFEKEVPM
jgi:subtilisin family serine protease